ncbi:MAG: tRNA (N6-isopentenyl adenosine(37)-C2)-methylthiotransferase MiaB, partial [Lachnospiraceae bacterium]|nr:tRNA (N6-isopentenyl adenosine(37)-C2)-methylthiotransferase MiaB [Lachnospiraceae bacterium]
MEDRQEVLKQKEIIEELRRRFLGTEKTFCIVTFGCQMNARDSEKLTGILERIGFKETDSEDADIVIFNTCTVRENADLRVYGRLGQLKKLKEKQPDKIIGLCGCMMQESAVVEKIRRSYSFVDIIFGTHNIFKFPEILKAYFDSGSRIIDLWEGTDRIVEDLPVKRKYPFKTGINIMFGCDNFCSYCIVPYVRGRERSREPGEILDEIRRCVDDGVK